MPKGRTIRCARRSTRRAARGDRAAQALEDVRQAAQHARQDEAGRALETIGACWDRLTDAERQALVRACVDRIVLQNGKIEVYYAIDGAPPCAADAG